MNQAAIIIAISMLLSRVLGIVREMLLAGIAGISAEKNALDLAFLIPDILNHVISTGFLSIIFIPIFTGYLTRKDENGAWIFFSNIFNTLGILLLLLIIPSFIWMRELIQFFTSAANLDSSLLERATYFGRIILPAQLFIFAGSFLVAVQHTRKQFLIPSLTGLIYNAAIILGGLIGRNQGLEGFAFGVPAGAFIGFFLLQIFGVKRGGIHYKAYLNFTHPDVSRYLKMMIPMSLGVGTMFGLELVIRSFGGFFETSGISSLNYAYRIMYTLVAVFGFSVGVAGYPDMARLVKENQFAELNRKIWKSLSRMFVILVPAGVTVAVLAFPAVRILFERGAFSRETTEFVSGLLRWYLPASFGMCLQAVLIRSFYASEQMWTPTLLNTGIFILTLPCYLIFGKLFGIYSIPLIGALGALLQVSFMTLLWSRKNGTEGMALGLKNMGKALCSGILVFIPLFFLEKILGHFFRELNFIPLVFICGILGIFIFSFILWVQKILGSDDASDLIGELFRKFTRKISFLKKI